MKKSTLVAIYNMLNGQDVNVEELKAEVTAEYERVTAKANANAQLYAEAHDAVMAVMSQTPLTVAEIYEACSEELHEGFTDKKVQYALLHYWNDAVEKVENGKKAFKYKLKG